MSVKFSGQHIYVQFIDDTVGKTLAAVGSRDKAAGITKCGANARNAEIIGRLAAEAAKSKGLSDVLFDKGGARYHGKVRALAEAAHGAGLKF
jgi:large subunit ribosomal protein L18